MEEICTYCGEDVGHEPDCPITTMNTMQEQIERYRDYWEGERGLSDELLYRLEELAAGPLDKPKDYDMPNVCAAVQRTIAKVKELRARKETSKDSDQGRLSGNKGT